MNAVVYKMFQCLGNKRISSDNTAWGSSFKTIFLSTLTQIQTQRLKQNGDGTREHVRGRQILQKVKFYVICKAHQLNKYFHATPPPPHTQ